jgi:predicted ABC-type ATPase
LGGATIASSLGEPHRCGLKMRVWYCGLRDVELHIARVRASVKRGGHDIPESKIRERFDASREHLCTLVPSLYERLLYDNSAEADLFNGSAPEAEKLLHYRDHKLLYLTKAMPNWAKPIAAVVLTPIQ